MAFFKSGSIDLHYLEKGSGPAVVLLHGFGMSGRLCWDDNGWLDLLAVAGFHAVALDSRGHGSSDKPISASDYSADLMTEDVVHLLDHLGVDRAHLAGHSMGSRTAFDLALKYPSRALSIFSVSVGSNLFQPVRPEALINAFEGGDLATVPEAIRQTVEILLAVGNRKASLVACLRSPRPVPRPEDLRVIDQPVLVACGERDAIVGDPNITAAALPRAEARIIAGCEHTDLLASRELKDLGTAFFRSAAGIETGLPTA